MLTKKTYELSKEEVCLALIDYIERDKDEKVTGTPILYITGNEGTFESIKLETIKV